MKTNLLLLLIFLSPKTALSKVVDLKFTDLPKLIKSQNIIVQAEQLQLDGQISQKGHLKRSFLPHLEFNLGAENFNTKVTGNKTQPFIGVEIESNIYNAGQDRAEEKIIELESEIQALNVFETINEKLLEARETYLESLYLVATQKLLVESLKKNEKLKKSTLKRIKTGLVPKSDETKFLLTKLTLKSKIQELELEIKSNFNKLRQLLALDENVQLMIEDLKEFSFIFELPKTFEMNNKIILIKKLQNELLQSKLQKGIYKKFRLPRVDLFFEYSYQTQREEEEIETFSERYERVVGIKLVFNLFDGNTSSTKEIVQSFKEMSLKQKLSGHKKIFNFEYKSQLARLSFLNEKSKGLQRINAIREKLNTQIWSDYRRGVKDSGQVQEAYNELRESKLETLEINKEIQMIKIKILKDLGEI